MSLAALGPDTGEKRLSATDLGLAGLIALAGWLLYCRALGLGLTYDDFFHLHFLDGCGFGEYLYRPEVWQRLPNKMITQLLFFSFDVDSALFGIDARAFLIHQLVSFSLCVGLLYLVLRLWLPRAWAALGTVLFALGPVTVSIAPLLMVRHYVEATLLGLLATGGYILALRRPERWKAFSIASAAVYLLAMLAKEIAVPLVVFLVLIPETTFRRRLTVAIPHGVALAAYLGYRLFMLGTFGGGYGWLIGPSDLPRLAMELPVKIGAEILGRPSTASWALLATLLVGLGLVAWRARGAGLLLGVAALLAMLPILPVSTEMEPRYALPAWLVLSLSFPFAVEPLTRKTGAARLAGFGLVLVALGGAFVAHLDAREETFTRLERMSAENRAFMDMGPGEMLRAPLGPPATMGELVWFRKDVLKRSGPGGAWFYDDYYLCVHPDPGKVRGWDPIERKVIDQTSEIPAMRRRHCGAIRGDAPLSLAMEATGRALRWTLGPYPDGRYSFVFGDGVQAFEMPVTGGFQLRQTGRMSLRLKYESPQGWATYSPELAMDFSREKQFRWSR